MSVFGRLGFGGESAPPEAGAKTAQPKAEGRMSDWQVNMGPLAFGNKGIEVKPQLLVGASVANFKAEAGIHDVRDGLKVSATAEAAVEAKATGRNIKELHDTVACDTPGFREALEAARQLLAFAMPKGSASPSSGGVSLGGSASPSPKANESDEQATISREDSLEVGKKVAQAIGVDMSVLQKQLASGSSSGTPMTLIVEASTGFGASASVCLGWCDTKGYHMVGVGGEAKAAFSLSMNVFAGRHKTGESAKMILGIGNFKFDYTFPLPRRSSASTSPASSTKGSGAASPAAGLPPAAAGAAAADEAPTYAGSLMKMVRTSLRLQPP